MKVKAKMKKYSFNVGLDTELGIRYGIARLTVTDNKVCGLLSILNHTEPFCGTINADSSCTVRGKIISLMKEVDYTAVGYITDDMIILTVKTDKADYVLKGTPIKEKIQTEQGEDENGNSY